MSRALDTQNLVRVVLLAVAAAAVAVWAAWSASTARRPVPSEAGPAAAPAPTGSATATEHLVEVVD